MTQSLANTQISRPVNVDTVVPTTASRQQSISDIVSQFSTMSINGAKSTYPVVTKRLPRSLLPKFVGSKAKSATASDIRIEARINARRDRIVKKLGYPSIQRPKQQTSAVVGAARKHIQLKYNTLGKNYREGKEEAIVGPIGWFVDFSQRTLNTPTRIPSESSGRRSVPRVGFNIPAELKLIWLPRLISSARGTSPHCEARPCDDEDDRDMYGLAYNGRECLCHGPPLKQDWHVRPSTWATTPAEADVDPSRKRKVRFAGKPTFIPHTDDHGRWIQDAFWTDADKANNKYNFTSADQATREDDERAIQLLDSATTKISSADLQAVFDSCNFSDDD